MMTFRRLRARGPSRPRRTFTGLAVAMLSAGAAPVLLVVSSAPALAQAPPETTRTVPASEIVRRVRAGEPIDLSESTIQGDLDLRKVGRVAQPLRCVHCDFRGSVNAIDVIFERAVDLSHSTMARSVDLTGSVFKDHVAFDETTFEGPLTAGSARMLDSVSFARSRFRAAAMFDRARLRGQVTFTDGTFAEDAGFRATEFEAKSNFSRTTVGRANLQGAVFGDHTNFSLAKFPLDADFDGAQFSGGGSFRGAQFWRSAKFSHVDTAKDLSFEGALIMGQASFTNISSSGFLSLDGLRLDRGPLFMSGLATRDLSMDVNLIVKHVEGPRDKDKVLEQLEQSAQSRNALWLANQARFARLSLEATDTHGLERFSDLLYRNVLGYLVRPLQPLLGFWLLVLGVGLARALPEMWNLLARRAQGGHRAPAGLGRVPTVVQWTPARSNLGSVAPALVTSTGGAVSLRTFVDLFPLACRGWGPTFTAAFGRKPDIELSKRDGPEYLRAFVLWVEFLTYKGLILAFLVALSNSNSTARQIFDNVWKG